MTTNPPPGSRAFLQEVWRVRPAIYPGFFAENRRRYLTVGRFRAWCKTQVRARLYTRTEGAAPGSARAYLIGLATDGLAVYDHFAERGEPVTLLLNGVDSVDPAVARLQDTFDIPYSWRRGDVVATLSAKGAGIGYHAGREDGFIVQLSGIREWKVWGSSVLSIGYRESLCGNPNEQPPDPRPATPPLLSCVLNPGDALYVPALFPHEGVTVETSLSLSIAWQGISAYDVWVLLQRVSSGTLPPPVPADSGLFHLIADPPPGAEAVESFLSAEIARSFERLVCSQMPAPAQIAAFVSELVGKG